MRYLFILVLFAAASANAQWKTYTLGPKGDTLNRVDLKGKKQGPWVVQVPELRGERAYEEEGYYENDMKEGVWKRFSAEGDILAMETYRLGMKHGKAVYFTNAGDPLREESWRAIDPSSPYDTVDVRDVNDPSIVLRKEIIKVEPASYKHGTWTYYNTLNGTVEKTEQWVMNKPKEEVMQQTDDGLAPIDVSGGNTSTTKKEEKKEQKKPQAILDYEKKNSGKKKVKVRDGQTGG